MSDAWAADRLDALRRANPVVLPDAKQSAGPDESALDKSAGPEPVNSAGEKELRGAAILPVPARLAGAEKASRQGLAAVERSDAPPAVLLILAVSHAFVEEPKERPAQPASSARWNVPSALQVRLLLELAPPAEARQEEAASVPRELVPVAVPPESAAAVAPPDESAYRV